jgi:photosystem II stability/assembly factor-like uncharacterized protein
MPAVRHLSFKDGDVLLLIGTVKGAFLARRRGAAWSVGGPYFPGQSVYAMAYDRRAGRHRIWAGPESSHFGAVLRSSDDFGRTWTEPKEPNLHFPKDTGLALERIWQITPGRESEPAVLYCGTAPAALFVSPDNGVTWSLARGLHEHPHRAKWRPGGDGLCLHTIVPHPQAEGRMLVAVSAAGVYVTSDAGRTWRASNRGIRAEFLPDKHPEFGQCVHKVVRHPARPDRFFLQSHWGLYRSDDGGASWNDVANGVPSDFGFAMAIHPHDPDTVYVVPLESDQFRCPPGARLRVYRTPDAGRSWRPLSRGLPAGNCYDDVLRDALATDSNDPAGVYFGTRGGRVFASKDAGTSWTTVADGLPGVTCVKAVVVAPAPRRPKAR